MSSTGLSLTRPPSDSLHKLEPKPHQVAEHDAASWLRLLSEELACAETAAAEASATTAAATATTAAAFAAAAAAVPRARLMDRSSLWQLAEDLDYSLTVEQFATLDGARGEVEEEVEEAEEERPMRRRSLDDGTTLAAAPPMTDAATYPCTAIAPNAAPTTQSDPSVAGPSDADGTPPCHTSRPNLLQRSAGWLEPSAFSLPRQRSVALPITIRAAVAPLHPRWPP